MITAGLQSRAKRLFGRTPRSSAVMFILLMANVVQGAKIFDLFWPDASRTSYLLEGLISLAYVAVAIIQGEVLIALAAMTVLFYLMFGHLVFVLNTGFRANFNAIVTYFPMLTFIVFANSHCSMRTILRTLLQISFGYSLFYVLINGYILSNVAAHASVILGSHDGDGGRVYLAAAYPAFVALYALRAKRANVFARLAMLVVPLIALVMSGTRLFLGVFLLVFAIGIARHMNAGVRLMLTVLVLTAMGIILAGVFWVDWNPFSWFAADNSGLYRAFEYDRVVKVMQTHWLFGVGTPTNFNDLQAYLKTPKYSPIYASDLGIIAAFFEFGIIGLLLFIGVTCFSMMAPVESRGAEFQALKLTCITLATYAIISPLLLLEPASVFVMLLIALRIRESEPAFPTTAPKGQWFFHIAEE